MKNLITAIRNTGLFQKLFLAFVLVMLIPIFISYWFSQKSTTRFVVNRVFEETQNSLEVVGNQIGDVLLRMIYVALYLNNDENVRAILLETGPGGQSASRVLNLERWNRLNIVGKMFDNLAFNVMRTKCYFTLVSPSGYTYTSWPSQGTDMKRLLAAYPRATSPDRGMFVRWVGLERNRIAADASLYPYVITLTKTLSDRQGNARYGTLVVSIPETEVRSMLNRGSGGRSWYLVDGDFTVISSSDPAVVGCAILADRRQALSTGPEGHFLTDIPGRGRSLVTWRAMQSGGWTLLTIESYSSITAQLDRIRWQLIWANLLSALAFIAVAALIARGITRPIHALAGNMRNLESEISRGDSRRVARTDEIGMLEGSYELMRRKIKRLMREISEKERKRREAELEALQLQVSPHFLFNTLSSVRWAILNNNNRKAADMVFALGNLLRMSLLKTNELITVDQEMENLTHYIDIIKLRHARSFTVHFAVEEQARQDLVPRLILQPLVENAVIHGLDNSRTGGVIEIGASREGRNLVLTVRDNGKGMKETAAPGANGARTAKLSGIGTRNVDERIKLIYGAHYGLRSESAPGRGTTATVVIPVVPGRKPA